MGTRASWLWRLVDEMPQEYKAWRKFGMALTAVGGAFAFMVWWTVRRNAQQDLPLWPAWIFALLGCMGLLLTAATLLHLPPFRASRPHRNI
jgi:dipeptide/tripeptide permease